MESTYSESLAAFVERIYYNELFAEIQGNPGLKSLVD